MATAARMAMPTEAQVLTLAQWLSPAYPVGAFAYSHGLEGAVGLGWVKDGAGLEAWLEEVLEHGAGHNDAVFLAAAYHAEGAAELSEIAEITRSFAASKERLFETERQGVAFAAVTAPIWGGITEGLPYPVAVGAAAAREALPLGLTLQMFLQAFLSNLVSAGQRLLPLGQSEAQAILCRLAARIPAVTAGAAAGDLDHLSASAFLTDIAAMHHETQGPRIFRT